MTTITVQARDGAYSVQIDGHASYGPAGADIVCAGISGACYVVAEGARALVAAGLADLCDVQAGDGAFKARVTTHDIHGRIACGCWYDGLVGAFSTLAAQYPDNVRVMGGGARE
ncbi:MAG: ribosomal-processing cysteine protease Prp [Kiritimatiellales bacterium]